MVILTSSETNNHSNNVDFVTKLDFREKFENSLYKSIFLFYNIRVNVYAYIKRRDQREAVKENVTV